MNIKYNKIKSKKKKKEISYETCALNADFSYLIQSFDKIKGKIPRYTPFLDST